MEAKAKKFRLFDAVLAAVCIVLVVESSAPAAAIGNAQFFWWIFLLLGFFLPYGLVSAELGTSYEDEGGIYDWVRRAYGERWGARVAWYYYINFALWMGSLAVLFTDVIENMTGYAFPTLTAVFIQLFFIWAIVFLGNTKLNDSKWILNLAAIIKAAIMLTIGGLGIYSAIRFGSVNDFTPQSFIPSFDAKGLSYLTVIIFNFLGFEVVTTFASEMKRPDREIPKAIVLGGIVIAVFYLIAAFGIGVAVPTEELSASGGILDSFRLLTGRESGALIIVFGVLFLYTLAANLLSWSFGVNYVAKYAAKEGALPSFMGIEDGKGMPIGANITNGLIASVMVAIAPLIPGEDVFWSFFALNMVMLLISYIMMFPTFYRLRKKDPDRTRPFRVKGGRAKLLLISFLPMVLLIAAVVFSVVPLDTSRAELTAKLPVLIGTVVSLLIGELLAMRAVRIAPKRKWGMEG